MAEEKESRNAAAARQITDHRERRRAAVEAAQEADTEQKD